MQNAWKTSGLTTASAAAFSLIAMCGLAATVARGSDAVTIAADARPGVADSAVYGMSNSGAIVGSFGTLSRYHGYIYQNDIRTTVDFPSLPNGSSTELLSINSSGIATGDYFHATTEETHSFIYNSNTGTFLSPTHPQSVVQGFNGINDLGQVAAPYYDAQNIVHSAIYNSSTNTWIDLPDHGPFGTAVQSISANGDAVVNFLDAQGNIHGAVYSDGAYTEHDFPGAKSTSLSMINASGVIAGTWIDDTDSLHGLILTQGSDALNFGAMSDGAGGTFYSVDFAGAASTIITHGLNDANQLAGFYVDGNFHFHAMGGQANVPEPASLSLLAAGAMGLRRRRRCASR